MKSPGDRPGRCNIVSSHILEGTGVRAPILTHDILGDFGVGGFDIDRILQTFFIIPHLTATSFHFPWKWLLNPFPGTTTGIVCSVDR